MKFNCFAAAMMCAVALPALAQDGAAMVIAPAGTPVALELSQPISSKTAKPGDRFQFTLAEAVAVGGQIILPAGTPGEGEVIHSARARLGGKAGELSLAARALTLGERRVRLRAFQLVATGKDRTGGASAVMIAGALAVPGGSLAAFLVKAGDVEALAGAIGVAKLAEAESAQSPGGADSTNSITTGVNP